MTGPAAQPELSSADLCKACGLCCRGVWFKSTTLEQDELEKARSCGFEVVQEGASSGAVQPCPQFKEGCCASYHTWRPAVCSDYRCRVLADFEAGALTAQTALSHVKAAVAMAERIFAEVGQLEGGIRGAKFVDKLEAAPTHNTLSPSARLDAVALRMYYTKHFECHESS